MTPDSYSQDRAIAARLPRSWGAFFARFGRLTDIQRETVPSILDGRDVLVCSATASGKTEAVCAPLIERHAGTTPWTILYVCPTRALVNDLYERLVGPCDALAVHLVRRTGDHNEIGSKLPNLLITTPESLDSMLCRGRRTPPHLLMSVCAVVIDEVHLLFGTARGAQVKWLLQRLRRLRRQGLTEGWLKKADIQVCALSATVDTPSAVMDAYLVGGQCLNVSGAREIEEVVADCESPDTEHALPAYVRALKTSEKILVFANSRKRVDSLAHRLKPAMEQAGYQVRAHHGSLARKIREESEEAARTQSRIVLFATSTLEIGVDIGDIDLVVLDGPTHDVRSLLQRIGRGNRRTDKTRVMACSGSVTEVLVHAAMLDAARAGYLVPQESGPQFAVARQQVASYIFQAASGVRSRAILSSLISECEPEIDAATLLEHVLMEGEFKERPDGLALGEDWIEASVTGAIHSNIESQPGQTVIDDDSGAEIATGMRFREGPGLVVAGQSLRVTDRSAFQLLVKASNHAGVATGRWSYVTGAWMQGLGQPDAVRRWLGFGPGQWPVLRTPGQNVVFHFGGARRRCVCELIRIVNGDPTSVVADAWALRMPVGPVLRPKWVESIDADRLSVALPERLESFERLLARPQANKRLPLSLRIQEIRGWLNLEGEVLAIKTAEWIVPSPARAESLRLVSESV